MSQTPNPWPVARYRLTEKAFIPRQPGEDHELIDPDAVSKSGVTPDPFVIYDGMPGPHMQPTCPLGEAAVAEAKRIKAGDYVLDPTKRLSLIVGEPAEMQSRAQALFAELLAIMAQQATMGAAFLAPGGALAAQAVQPITAQPQAGYVPPAPPAPAPVYAAPKAPPLRGQRQAA